MKRDPLDASGTSLVFFTLALPVLTVLLGGAVDYAYWLSDKATVQNAADGAALTAAKELRLGSANPKTIAAAARNEALAVLGPLADQASVTVTPSGNQSVSVVVSLEVTSLFGGLSPFQNATLTGSATAQSASTPTCLISLNTSGNGPTKGPGLSAGLAALGLAAGGPGAGGITIISAAINANDCATYSNSQSAQGLSITDGTLTAFQSCSAGGAVQTASYVNPPAVTDCPVITDPLASRAAPSYSGCDYNNVVVKSGSTTLSPGVYCGGLTITGGAQATLNSGVYTITGGPLAVNQNATLQGSQVGFYLADNKSLLNFDQTSTVDLVAPADGPLAGILFFEDRGVKLNNQHVLASRNAPQLLGTLYFPRGQLSIGSSVPDPSADALTAAINSCAAISLAYPCSPPTSNVGQYSAWTIIIANSITVSFVVNLVLNTNYSASSTKPPPEISMKGASLTQ